MERQQRPVVCISCEGLPLSYSTEMIVGTIFMFVSLEHICAYCCGLPLISRRLPARFGERLDRADVGEWLCCSPYVTTISNNCSATGYNPQLGRKGKQLPPYLITLLITRQL